MTATRAREPRRKESVARPILPRRQRREDRSAVAWFFRKVARIQLLPNLRSFVYPSVGLLLVLVQDFVHVLELAWVIEQTSNADVESAVDQTHDAVELAIGNFETFAEVVASALEKLGSGAGDSSGRGRVVKAVGDSKLPDGKPVDEQVAKKRPSFGGQLTDCSR